MLGDALQPLGNNQAQTSTGNTVDLTTGAVVNPSPVFRYTNPLEAAVRDPLRAGGYYDAPPGVATVPGGQYFQNPDGSFISQNPEDRIREDVRKNMQTQIDAT